VEREQNQKAVKGWREQTHKAEWREPNSKGYCPFLPFSTTFVFRSFIFFYVFIALMKDITTCPFIADK
jgi:hypothetical protein